MSDAPDTAPKGGSKSGASLKATLGKKVGPLPLGVWILAVGGGLMLTYYMRRSGGAEAETTTEEETGVVDTGGTGVGSWPYGYPNGVGQWPGQTADDDTATDGTLPTTNEQWQRRAVQVLVGRGYEPTAVDRAIGAYLGGEGLTTVQRAIINEAILLIGPPPVSPPSPTTPDEPPPTTTPPTEKPPPKWPTTPPTGGVKLPVPPPHWTNGPAKTPGRKIAGPVAIRNPSLEAVRKKAVAIRGT